MRVLRWGNSLAVLLPKALVEELHLKEGDELEVVAASKENIAAAESDKRAEFLTQAEQFRFPLPEGYRFDRGEANGC